jgi:hypothetical protein
MYPFAAEREVEKERESPELRVASRIPTGGE